MGPACLSLRVPQDRVIKPQRQYDYRDRPVACAPASIASKIETYIAAHAFYWLH